MTRRSQTPTLVSWDNKVGLTRDRLPVTVHVSSQGCQTRPNDEALTRFLRASSARRRCDLTPGLACALVGRRGTVCALSLGAHRPLEIGVDLLSAAMHARHCAFEVELGFTCERCASGSNGVAGADRSGR